ncbi:LLM class flavin-dependent oxidoreductase [Bradyrhizobium sp. INPA03-11B]|uniref:LLM class flavin-dependent oxidoreductase n=1 Tax=Bradyrhizobium sp. INPA03-11B TaxID=418598 RepID=UPI00338DA547
MIKIWSFEFWNAQGTRPSSYEDEVVVQQAFESNMKVIETLDRIGFEGVFFSEHHFLAALIPCPNLVIAAAAQRTKRLRLGVMGNVLPFHQPFRIAEELAMLDYLCGDRLEIGYASGIAPEYLFVNIPQDEIRPRFTEMLDFMAAARESKLVSHQGKFYQYDELYSMPRRKRPARRREWMAIYTEGAANAAARRDMKIACGYQSVANMTKVFDAYRDQMAAEGRRVSPDDMAIRRSVLIAESDTEAAELHEKTLQASRRHQEEAFLPLADRITRLLGRAIPEGVAASGVKDAQFASALMGQTETKKGFSVFDTGMVDMNDEFIFGSPTTVAERLIDQCRRTGAGNLCAYHPASFDYSELAHHYRLWEQVMPIVASTSLDSIMA